MTSCDEPSQALPVEPRAQPRTPISDDGDRCPLCGEPITYALEPTEDGPEWLGHCVECNAVVETML